MPKVRYIKTKVWCLRQQRLQSIQGHEKYGKMAFESVAALSEILKNYGECVKEQDITRRKWCRSIDEWVEEAKRQVEEQASRPENETLEVGGQARSHGGESEEVVADVMLQHKERILDEVPTTDDVWYWQAELWAKRCKICRIREGVGRRHDWRVCPKYPGDCDVVRKVHMEVKIGTGMLENVGQMNGYCKGCNLMKQGCWMQLKDSAHHTGCRYKGVVTETVAAILANGLAMVRE